MESLLLHAACVDPLSILEFVTRTGRLRSISVSATLAREAEVSAGVCCVLRAEIAAYSAQSSTVGHLVQDPQGVIRICNDFNEHFKAAGDRRRRTES